MSKFTEQIAVWDLLLRAITEWYINFQQHCEALAICNMFILMNIWKYFQQQSTHHLLQH